VKKNIVEGIKAGNVEWGNRPAAVLQAYLPVVVMANYHRYVRVLPGNNITTWSGFRGRFDGLELVEKFAKEYR
jgi:simple sugar transport system substrate-binding protein